MKEQSLIALHYYRNLRAQSPPVSQVLFLNDLAQLHDFEIFSNDSAQLRKRKESVQLHGFLWIP